jgi:amino acid transporter
MEYKASLDTVAKIVTAVTVILFFVIGYRSIKVLMLLQSNKTSMLIYGGLLLLFVVIIIGCFLFSPQYYKVDNNYLTIVRPVKNKTLKLNDIDNIRPLEKDEMNGAIRTFGVGGLFGYFGKYYYPKIGNMTFYATQKRNRILIETRQGQNFIITPDDQSIIENIKGKAGIK